MRKLLGVLIGGLTIIIAARAQMALTSLGRSGQLTWTNSVSNVTYRVEWSGSLAGPWQRFDAQTNLSSLFATGTTVTVQVPLSNSPAFYRAVWSDAPFFAGLYEFREYDLQDTLIATGRLWLAHQPEAFSIRGTLDLHLAEAATNSFPPDSLYGPQFGVGEVAGTFDTSQNISLGLPLNWWDNDVNFSGALVGNTYLGHWSWNGISSTPMAEGTFIADRQHADAAAPANPVGFWLYRGSGSGTTGIVSFASSTPATGSYTFGERFPFLPSEHLLGQGTFTNAIVSGNHLTITIPTTNGVFAIEAEMCGELFAGFWQWAGTNRHPKGVFTASRIGSR